MKEKTQMAKIALNKSLCKEYNVSNERTVYLENGSEFQIQIFNPHNFTVGAKIFVNGTRINHMLVLRPGERIWLERFLDKSVKFKFETYDVELDNDNRTLVENAIKNNGEVKVSFYREDDNKIDIDYEPQYYKDYYLDKAYSNVWHEDSSETLSCSTKNVLDSSVFKLNNLSFSVDATSNTFNSNTTFDKNSTVDTKYNYEAASNKLETKETGRIGKGDYSNQKFDYVSTSFSTFSFNTEVIKLLPMSQKNVSANDLQKRYCVECGHKLNPKHKFCPYCGTKCN